MRPRLFVEVAYGADWWDPFISAVSGPACLDALQEIEREAANEEMISDRYAKGRGKYLFEAVYDGGDPGAYPPYWDLSVVAFRRFQEGETDDRPALAPPPVETEAPYPFLRKKYEVRSFPCDADEGWVAPEAWPLADGWMPGARHETTCDSGGAAVDYSCDADGTGAILLTEFAAFRNVQGREMVTYKRRWRDPDGRVFGKGDYRVCSREKFARMAKGYAFDFEVTD